MRKFTPYEINQLIKFGFDPFELASEVDANIPVEYITGKAEFRGEIYEVSKDVLIPRVETEGIINIALNKIEDRSRKYEKITFADVGTGSGAIGISFALELEKLIIPYNCYLSDKSQKALDVARKNVEEMLVKRKVNCFTYQKEESSVKIVESDLLSNYPKKIQFDVIFANLPYIPSSRIDTLDSSVKDYEPMIALDGGTDGLKFIRELLQQAELKLANHGIILLEVDDNHDEEFLKSQESILHKFNTELKKDQFGRTRFWICTLK
ncbi:MAG: HemK/PrmC family methyltransferase [Candidatus Dojkabacteria bacterium]